MPLLPGDVSLVPPLQPTYGKIGNTAVPVYQAHFLVRGKGPYSVMIAREGWTPQILQQAIEEEARKIVETMEIFK